MNDPNEIVGRTIVEVWQPQNDVMFLIFSDGTFVEVQVYREYDDVSSTIKTFGPSPIEELPR